jgi:Bifunctional DNA primase/polymerase, N-terminal
MTSALIPLRAAALDYAGRNGWSVFPLWPRSKKPACRRGYKDATTNPATIRRWWLAQDYNIGIATGLTSGVWVFDVDGATGAATLGDLETKNGNLPATLISVTSAGPHFWFRATGEIQLSAGRVGDGCDVRAEDGYVLAPPSVHPDGPVYRWGNDAPIAAAPDWLIQLTRKRPTISERAIATMRVSLQHCAAPGAYGRAALQYEITALASTPNGQRNHALNRAAFSLFQLVASGELDESEVINQLIEASFANGLMSDDGPTSVKRTIASGRRAGLQHPRDRSGAT